MGNSATLAALISRRAALDEQRQREEFDAAWEKRHRRLPGRARTNPRPSLGPISASAIALAAARGLGQPFGLSALVLACWRACPRLFGLPGCEEMHPCSKRVQICLCGRRSLIARGLIRRVGKLYEVVIGP